MNATATGPRPGAGAFAEMEIAMAQLKPGTRMRSATCDTEVMIIAAPSDDAELTCGGAPLIGISETPAAGAIVAPAAGVSLMPINGAPPQVSSASPDGAAMTITSVSQVALRMRVPGLS